MARPRPTGRLPDRAAARAGRRRRVRARARAGHHATCAPVTGSRRSASRIVPACGFPRPTRVASARSARSACGSPRACTMHGFALNCNPDLAEFNDRPVRHRRCGRHLAQSPSWTARVTIADVVPAVVAALDDRPGRHTMGRHRQLHHVPPPPTAGTDQRAANPRRSRDPRPRRPQDAARRGPQLPRRPSSASPNGFAPPPPWAPSTTSSSRS